MSDRRGYQFVDTNILVYGHDNTAGAKFDLAKALIETLWETQDGCTSIQVLQEFYVTITRKVARPLPPDQASRIIAAIGRWRTHSPLLHDVQDAISIQTRYDISFWDAMIIRSAVHLGCDIIWSEDLNDGQRYQGVLVMNPFSVEQGVSPTGDRN